MCEPAQSKRMSSFHKSHLIRKLTSKVLQTKTTPQTLCEPAPSKRMSRFHNTHFLRKFTVEMPQAKLSPEPGRTLCASLRSRNACQGFTRATLYGNLQVNVLDPISLLGSKMPQAKTALQTLCEPAQSKRMSRFHKSHFIRKFTGKMQRPRVSTLINYRPFHLP